MSEKPPRLIKPANGDRGFRVVIRRLVRDTEKLAVEQPEVTIARAAYGGAPCPQRRRQQYVASVPEVDRSRLRPRVSRSTLLSRFGGRHFTRDSCSPHRRFRKKPFFIFTACPERRLFLV